MIQNLGYACINESLRAKGITTNRSLKLNTLKTKGIQFASKLALQNVYDLQTVIEWNIQNQIKFFRLSSDIFPWGNKLDVTKFPDYKEIVTVLGRIGKIAKENGLRLTCHPGPFNLLASPNEVVVQNTIADLEMHARMFNLLELSDTPYNKINIHIGATYNDKANTVKTWIRNYKRLSNSCAKRITVENDDKGKMYSVKDLYDTVYSELGVPIVFDYHHHTFNTGDLSEEAALKLATSTWDNITPIVHYSESKALHENNSSIRAQAHSDFLHKLPNTYNVPVDVMLECKAKELALLKIRN
jgi:UV DNA damage endonuclease